MAVSASQIQQLYIAYYGRPADPAGLAYWQAQAAAGTARGTTDAAILDSFGASFGANAEYTATFANMSDVQKVNTVYNNLFSHDADPVGLLYWATKLTNGDLTIANIVRAVSTSAVTAANVDGTAFNSKVTAAESFTGALTSTAQILGYTGTAAGVAAKAWITGVNSAATLATAIAAPALAATVATVAAPAVVAGQTFTLTTGVDTGTAFTGGTAGDTFNAILGTGATLNSFDSINGGSGTATDTLNIADNSTAAFAMPASTTISGFENVVLSRSGATGAADVTVTNSTFGAGVQTFSTTNAGANTTGAVSVTLAAGTTVSAVSSGTAFTTVTVVDTDATSTTTQGSTLATVTATKATGAVQINGNGVTTVNLNTIGTLATITSAAGTRALTVNAAGTGVITGLTDAQATTVTLNQAGNQAFGALTVAKATTINANATATATTDATTATIAGAVATALNVGGTHAQTLTVTNAANPLLATITVTGSGGVALGDLSGLGALTSVNTAAATNVASAAGAANSTVANSVQLGVNAAFTGGAGSDTVTVGATTKAVNLGTGTNTANISVTTLGSGGSVAGGGADTLGLSDANAQTLSTVNATQTAFKAAVTGFSKLALGAQTASTTIVQGGFASFDTVSFTEVTGNVTTLSNLPTGSTVNITRGGTFTDSGLTTAGSLGANATDSLTIGFISTGAAQASSFGPMTLPNLVNLNLVSSGSATANVGGVNTISIADTALKVLNVSGTNGFVLGTLTGTTGFTTLNAGGLTGANGISVTLAANQFATTITGSSGTAADTINAAAALNTVSMTSTSTGLATLTGPSGAFVSTITRTGTGASTIVSGSVNDVITVGSGTNSITGAAGADLITINHGTATNVTTVIYGANASATSSSGANMDTIANFLSATDKIQLLQGASGTGSLNGITLAAGNTAAAILATVADTTSVATVAAVYTQLAADLNNVANAFAASTAGAGTIVARAVSFANGAAAGTYLVINDGVAAFQGANDIVIKLTGTTTFVAGDITVV